ncbi:MAG: hypothetical protein MJZ67_06020, partial [Bacteroidales bacterium]|nr:hypothetical protein [Bacteroidales bacterium]
MHDDKFSVFSRLSRLPPTYYLLPTTCSLPPTTYYLLPATYYLLPKKTSSSPTSSPSTLIVTLP